MKDPNTEYMAIAAEMLVDRVIGKTPSTAIEMQHREELRQKYIYENIKEAFKELAPDTKFMLLDELTRDEAMSEQKFMRLCFDNVIEPCPVCGSHDLFIKTKQEYKDFKERSWNPKYQVWEYRTVKVPWYAVGGILCGGCKKLFRVRTGRVPEIYKEWNKFAVDKRKW